MVIDVHAHILPGVDDGAKNISMTMDMLIKSSKAGVKKVVATPHFYPWGEQTAPGDIRKLCKEIQEKLQMEQGIEMEIYPGQEVFYQVGMVEELKTGTVLTLADSRYVLLEFMPDENFSVIYHAVRELINSGYIPVLAHVERYVCLKKTDNLLMLKDCGAWFQMNIDSIKGGLFSKIGNWSRKLLKDEMIDIVSSDMHNTEVRGPYTKEKKEMLLKIVGEEYMTKLLYENCERIICDI